MIEVGFWREHDGIDGMAGHLLSFLTKRPKIVDCQKPNWIHRSQVIAYLRRNRRLHESFYGEAKCVFCGEWIGNKEYTDGAFVWPEGLLHYVDKHDIIIPENRFVAQVRGDVWW